MTIESDNPAITCVTVDCQQEWLSESFILQQQRQRGATNFDFFYYTLKIGSKHFKDHKVSFRFCCIFADSHFVSSSISFSGKNEGTNERKHKLSKEENQGYNYNHQMDEEIDSWEIY